MKHNLLTVFLFSLISCDNAKKKKNYLKFLLRLIPTCIYSNQDQLVLFTKLATDTVNNKNSSN